MTSKLLEESSANSFSRPILVQALVEMNSDPSRFSAESSRDAFDRVNASIQNQIELLDFLSGSEWNIQIMELETELTAAMGEKDAVSFIRAMQSRRVNVSAVRANYLERN